MRRFFPAIQVRWIILSSASFLAMGLVGLVFMVEVSSQPEFCGTCHVMDPYFQSWETSTHKEVACVDCHIPPGIAHEVQKKNAFSLCWRTGVLIVLGGMA